MFNAWLAALRDALLADGLRLEISSLTAVSRCVPLRGGQHSSCHAFIRPVYASGLRRAHRTFLLGNAASRVVARSPKHHRATVAAARNNTALLTTRFMVRNGLRRIVGKTRPQASLRFCETRRGAAATRGLSQRHGYSFIRCA